MRYSLKHIIALVVVTGIATVLGCKQDSPKKKKPTTSPYMYGTNYPSSPFNQPYNYNNGGLNGAIDITCVNGAGDVLFVTQNQPVTWTFAARSLTGSEVANITQIIPSIQNPNMQISGNSVNFRPINQQDLNGSLTVSATTTSGQSSQKTFTWRSGNGLTGTGGGLGGSLLPALMLTMLPGLITGNFDPSAAISVIGAMNNQNNPGYTGYQPYGSTPGYPGYQNGQFNNGQYNNGQYVPGGYQPYQGSYGGLGGYNSNYQNPNGVGLYQNNSTY